jgi:hypothetical protein
MIARKVWDGAGILTHKVRDGVKILGCRLKLNKH